MLRHVWKTNLALRTSCILSNSKRFKGHSHWQNIRHTKMLNDQKRSQMLSRYVWKIQGVINAHQGDTNPNTNSALAQVLEQAKKDSVPVTTLQNVLKKLSEQSYDRQQLYLKGPENYVLAITYDKKRGPPFRQALKKAIRETKVSMVEIPGVDDVYTTKGVIVSKPPSKDITMEKAEEIAIIAGAEEIEEVESADKEDRVFQFITLREDLSNVAKALRDEGWSIYENKLELMPLYYIDLPEEKVPQVNDFVNAVEELPEVEKVIVNIA